MKFDTISIHAGRELDPAIGSLARPIDQTSTFVFEDVEKHWV